MRRAFALIAASALMVLLAVPAAAEQTVASDTGPADQTIVLAVDDAPSGPEPMDRLDENNPARELAGFEDPDVPFTYGAAFILAFAGLMGLALLLGLYWLLVYRPSRESDSPS